MSEQTDQQDLRELVERRRLEELVDRYVTTLDEPTVFDEDWARSLFTEDVRLEHEIAVLEGVDEVAAAHQRGHGPLGAHLALQHQPSH